MSKKVELKPAFAWDCDECGRENFCRSIVAELSKEEFEELKAEHGVEEWDKGFFQQMPTEVVCHFCHAKFSSSVAMELDEQESEW